MTNKKHPDCEDRCQLLEHKGYHSCAQTGQCEELSAATTPITSAAIKRAEEPYANPFEVMVEACKNLESKLARERAENEITEHSLILERNKYRSELASS